MARVDIIIPEPTSQYTEENQRQVTQSLRTMQDKLNTSYQQELKNEQDAFNYFLS
jgi:ABC-type microcin C transport system duplicated ATPase subunit YejF|tara:strand:- start:1473 stop:1637 length:165 start_codon:yes stop_codon:yes gene_type:complete